LDAVTDVVIRQAGPADLAALAVLGHARQPDFARVVLSPSERSVPSYRRAGFGPADTLLLWTP
jgi:hypothetical protein